MDKLGSVGGHGWVDWLGMKDLTLKIKCFIEFDSGYGGQHTNC
jgi:hypothetical protein